MTDTTAQPKKEYYEAYVVRETKEGQPNSWVRIGAGFVNVDGSINVVLDANPLDGTFQLRKPKPKEETQA